MPRSLQSIHALIATKTANQLIRQGKQLVPAVATSLSVNPYDCRFTSKNDPGLGIQSCGRSCERFSQNQQSLLTVNKTVVIGILIMKHKWDSARSLRFWEQWSSRTLVTASSTPYNLYCNLSILCYDESMPIVFDWDEAKNRENQEKHGVSFDEAQYAFADPKRIINRDLEHSETEERFFCLGKVDRGILTVRFTYRGNTIRIFGAGFWRRGKREYEEEQRRS